ncbi:hypothetical protein RJT34_28690 [Clitoria ternatea]|uniref:Uncharacterized protein n=1 Tax=Clitoria ternatea TaxID=43366 RepID=A0AAN9F929_CLITE
MMMRPKRNVFFWTPKPNLLFFLFSFLPFSPIRSSSQFRFPTVRVLESTTASSQFGEGHDSVAALGFPFFFLNHRLT